MKTVFIFCAAFEGFPPSLQDVKVYDGQIKVYDAIAGYYTSCHSMSQQDQNRVLKAKHMETI